MPYICFLCKDELPEFKYYKDLVNRYKEVHKEQLKRFPIKHRPTKNSIIKFAITAQELCEQEGWSIKDCNVREL